MHFVWKEYSLKDTKVWVEKILCDLTFCTTLTISNVSFRAYKNLDVTCLPMRSWSTLHRNKSATQSVLLPRRPMIWRELLLIVFDALIHCCFFMYPKCWWPSSSSVSSIMIWDKMFDSCHCELPSDSKFTSKNHTWNNQN